MTAQIRELLDRSLPTFAIQGQRVTLMKLLRDREVYDTRDDGFSLTSFRSVSKISMSTITAGSHRVETVMTGETRRYLENDMERILRGRREISEMKDRLDIIPCMDRILVSNRRRYLQLVRVFLKRDMTDFIEADEVRERVSVFLGEIRGKDIQRLIIDTRVSILHFLYATEVSLMTSEALSRVEVVCEKR